MEFRTSRKKLFQILLIAVALTGVSFALTLTGDLLAVIVGWIGTIFFGLALIIIPFKMIKTDVKVIINSDGIEDKRSGAGLIFWHHIKRIEMKEVQKSRFLCLELEEPETYLSSMSKNRQMAAKINEKSGFSLFTITFVGLEPGIDKAWTYIKSLQPEKLKE